MIESISSPYIDFTVAAGRMAGDMGLPLEDCKIYAALIDADFADRLIAFAKATGEKIRVNHGNRPLSYQDYKANNPDNKYSWNPAKLPEGGGSILDQCRCWSHKAGTLLAPPGQSPHMCGIAIDVAAGKLKSASSASLKAYGLCKPVSGEAWHVEPILASRPRGYARYDLAVKLGMPFVWGRVKKSNKGVTVCQAQQALRRAGFAVAVDGIFGDKTKAEIEAFQRAQGLAASGIADNETFKALGLNKIDKGVNEMLIKIGSKGPVVVAWQLALITSGHPGSMDPAKIKNENLYGPATAAATKEFQKACGLPQNGEVDDATAAAMWSRGQAAEIGKLKAKIAGSISKTEALLDSLKV